MIRVAEIISHRAPPFLLQANMNAMEASRFLRKHHIGGAPVVRGGRLVGFCSERDIVYRVVAEKRDPEGLRIEEVMSRDVLCGSAEDSVVKCEHAMREAHVRHMPIVKNGKVVACISLRDLLQSELFESKDEVALLTDYIRGG